MAENKQIISQETATQIALAWREIETGEKLLVDVKATIDKTRHGGTDIRDAFGRTQHGLQLGVPSGDNSHRLFNVPFTLAVPVIEAHVAQQRAVLAALSEKAIIEARATQPGEV